VVTSNKELVATFGPELMALAHEKCVNYLFEGSVGGGIPIIRPLNQCLAANVINGISGILNGTTNYILTRMKKDGQDFAKALQGAKDKGYAEADPSADIEGHDACRKIAILSSIAYNQYVDYKKIPTKGITEVTSADMDYAAHLGAVVKLIAMSRLQEDGKIFAEVAPAMVPFSNPLSNVEDVFNAIVVKGDAIGDAMFYGRGAGKLPTASAVVADIIDIVKNIRKNNNNNIVDEGCALGVRNVWERRPYENMAVTDDQQASFFIRLSVRSREEATKFVRRIFGEVVFIHLDKPIYADDLAFVSIKEARGSLKQKLEALNGIGSVRKVLSALRIEEE
ncbi:MAG: homoserine dehydrogenase, partial [Clostridiales bacterium]|nr:homoserine dehydrogenase [Clostridiales bacterium]